MKIAFYAPIKSPNHPVPSGDRLMARLLIRALEMGGATIDLVSEFRSFRKAPPTDGLAGLQAEAAEELSRISAAWQREGVPDLFFTYHPYYKAPDFLGPQLAAKFSLPYVTAEASYSRRRDAAGWGEMQAIVADAVRAARVNISMTERDRDGLLANIDGARSAMLAPFIDPAPYLAHAPQPEAGRLVTVAMMRPGDKLDSYLMLAQALSMIADQPWTLSIIGDGPVRGEVEALFASVDSSRITWHGQCRQDEIAQLLSRSDIYLWPGCGEAYGLAYLEAQAAGLPVVAQAIAGVPSVVMDGETGVLTPPGDVAAYAQAIATLLADRARRNRLAAGARAFAGETRSLEAASRRLISILSEFADVAP